jgi:hypothetical protein
MIPAGYMAKRICKPPEAIGLPAHIVDIYSVSACVNDNFADFINSWKHNDFWFFDSPSLIHEVAKEQLVDVAGTHLFYYEVWEQEFAKEVGWRELTPSKFGLGVNPVVPATRRLEGYDVISTWVENSRDPEHSPLSCNGLAKEIQTNAHCLFGSLDQAKASIDRGEFEGGEPGTLRIVAVYSVQWPEK